MSDGVEFPAKPKCQFRGVSCAALRFPDGYPYCSQAKDERPELRPGMGAQVRGLDPICDLPAIGGLMSRADGVLRAVLTDRAILPE